MAYPIRFLHPGAIYHVMARGDDGEAVLETDDTGSLSYSGWARSAKATDGECSRKRTSKSLEKPQKAPQT